jgi:DNA-binding NarL/FixJ family response regulator
MPLRVLWLEADVEALQVGLAALRQAGCEVTVVPEVRWVEDTLHHQPFEVILLGDLPGLSPEEVLRRLRHLWGWTGPVHILTAAASLPAALACGQLGATSFQEKPPEPAALAACLCELLGDGTASPAEPPVPLTSQEKRVLYLVRWGWSNAEIARRLAISEETARGYVKQVLRKLGLPCRSGAACHSYRKKVL